MIDIKTGKHFTTPSARSQMTRGGFLRGGIASIIAAKSAPYIAVSSAVLAGSANATVGGAAMGMMRNIGARTMITTNNRNYDSRVEWIASSDNAYVDPDLTIQQGDIVYLVGGTRDVPSSGSSETELFSVYDIAHSDSLQIRGDYPTVTVNNGIGVSENVKNNDDKSAIALKKFTNGYCRPVFFGQREGTNIKHRNYTRVLRELTIFNKTGVRKHYFPVRIGNEGFIYEEIGSELYGNSDTSGTSLTYGDDVQ